MVENGMDCRLTFGVVGRLLLNRGMSNRQSRTITVLFPKISKNTGKKGKEERKERRNQGGKN